MLDWGVEEELEGKSHKEIETGQHMATLEKAEASETKTGTLYLNIWWRLANNQVAFQKVWLTDNAWNMFKMNMSKLNVKDQLMELKTDDFNVILNKAAELLTAKTQHAEIYVSYKEDGQYRNQNVMINDVFDGPMRDDGLVNHAAKLGFDTKEELPF